MSFEADQALWRLFGKAKVLTAKVYHRLAG